MTALGLIRAAAASCLLVLATASHATEIEEVVSPGGIKAWLVNEPSIPMVIMSYAFGGGASQDPADKPGVANMISVLLDEGAGDLTGQEFQRQAEEISVRYSFSASRDAFYGDVRTLTINLDEALELVRVALTEPQFTDDAVKRMRAQVMSGLRRQLQDPNSIAGKVWSKAVFGDHPYGRPVSGTLETVAGITSEDVGALHKRLFARDNVTVAVVGDIDAERLKPLLNKVFGGLPEKASLTAVSDAVLPESDVQEVVEVEVPQTVIQFGRPGLKRHDPDFVPAYVLNYILGGGGFSSRLYREVREKRGLAYSVYSYLYPLDHAGIFLGGVATRNDRAVESLDLIRQEIARIARDGPTESEFTAAKRYLKGSYALRFDTSNKITTQLVQIQLEDLGIDYINTRNDKIEAVTMDEVRKAAERLFANGNFYVSIVGKPEGITSDGG